MKTFIALAAGLTVVSLATASTITVDGEKLNMTNQLSSWIPLVTSIIAVLISGAFGALNYAHSRRSAIYDRRLAERQRALFDALRVIDLVYCNSEFSGMPKPTKREWDIQLARDAVNRMTIYCKDSERTIRAFYASVGLHNPESQKPPIYSCASINLFRREVARELDIKSDVFTDDTNAWISKLPGGANQECKSLQ